MTSKVLKLSNFFIKFFNLKFLQFYILWSFDLNECDISQCQVWTAIMERYPRHWQLKSLDKKLSLVFYLFFYFFIISKKEFVVFWCFLTWNIQFGISNVKYSTLKVIILKIRKQLIVYPVLLMITTGIVIFYCIAFYRIFVKIKASFHYKIF